MFNLDTIKYQLMSMEAKEREEAIAIDIRLSWICAEVACNTVFQRKSPICPRCGDRTGIRLEYIINNRELLPVKEKKDASTSKNEAG